MSSSAIKIVRDCIQITTKREQGNITDTYLFKKDRLIGFLVSEDTRNGVTIHIYTNMPGKNTIEYKTYKTKDDIQILKGILSPEIVEVSGDNMLKNVK